VTDEDLCYAAFVFSGLGFVFFVFLGYVFFGVVWFLYDCCLLFFLSRSFSVFCHDYYHVICFVYVLYVFGLGGSPLRIRTAVAGSRALHDYRYTRGL